MTGIPFALVCVGILVIAVVQLLGTLGSMDHGPSEDHETDEEGRIIRGVAALLLLALLLALAAGQVERRRSSAECARRLGITWSATEGATEHLDAFQRCTR